MPFEFCTPTLLLSDCDCCCDVLTIIVDFLENLTYIYYCYFEIVFVLCYYNINKTQRTIQSLIYIDTPEHLARDQINVTDTYTCTIYPTFPSVHIVLYLPVTYMISCYTTCIDFFLGNKQDIPTFKKT